MQDCSRYQKGLRKFNILNYITPTLQLWSDDRNPLKEYLTSLEKVYELDIALVLLGHRGIFMNCKERIQELKHHHEKRVEEILSILDKGNKTAFQVASQMYWEIIYDSWDFFPISQKWFATGEAIAHLKYLEKEGMVKRKMGGPESSFGLRSSAFPILCFCSFLFSFFFMFMCLLLSYSSPIFFHSSPTSIFREFVFVHRL
jgi:hypothetical protein